MKLFLSRVGYQLPPHRQPLPRPHVRQEAASRIAFLPPLHRERRKDSSDLRATHRYRYLVFPSSSSTFGPINRSTAWFGRCVQRGTPSVGRTTPWSMNSFGV